MNVCWGIPSESKENNFNPAIKLTSKYQFMAVRFVSLSLFLPYFLWWVRINLTLDYIIVYTVLIRTSYPVNFVWGSGVLNFDLFLFFLRFSNPHSNPTPNSVCHLLDLKIRQELIKDTRNNVLKMYMEIFISDMYITTSTFT